MAQSQAETLLANILSEITDQGGAAATDRFGNLRAVDAKVKETKLILGSMPGVDKSFIKEMDEDLGFTVNSRRVRLETLANYCRIALRLAGSGVLQPKKKLLYKAPELSKLTGSNTGLKTVIERRWIEAQRCVHAEAHLAAVIMMGSILEGLLLARATMDAATAHRAKSAPKAKGGGNLAIPDWNLNGLIEVAAEVGWIKSDTGTFSHALRQSRNIVHPWAEVSTGANFDKATCRTCWLVLTSSVDDLLTSVP